jgi:hypothetical protein
MSKNKVKIRNLRRDEVRSKAVMDATEEQINTCTNDLMVLQRTLRKLVEFIKQGNDQQRRLAQEMRREMADAQATEPEMSGNKTSLRREANLHWRTWCVCLVSVLPRLPCCLNPHAPLFPSAGTASAWLTFSPR